MGFDLSGLNPVMREIDENSYPIFHEYDGMDWEKRREIFDDDKKIEDKYWEEANKRDNENPGVYFRANVWWWRRLWQFICEECADILSEEDKEYGENNDFHEITSDKAVLIAKRLQEKVDDGSAALYEKVINDYIDSVEKDEHGNPKDSDNDWMANYPFKVDFLKEFITFCSESGGFTIG